MKEIPLLSVENTGSILRLTLMRGSQRNPLSRAMLDAIVAALEAAATDKSVRAIVIAGQAPGFCGGHDLKEMTAHRTDADGGRAFYEALFARCSEMMQMIVAHPKIVIAEVNGIATAAGCQLVAACDMAVAGASARFGVNGINSGLFCSTPMVALSRNIGRKRAMELLTTGALLNAHEAMTAGIVNRICADDDLAKVTQELATTLAERSQAVLALGKKAFYEQLEMPLDEAYRHTSKVIVDNMMMKDAEEGIGAFLEKRKPEWNDE
ncbi:enoyl-CoA hydratase [Anderseniella sp. Alg231-50]|uniref:enoyl-CoA hydratase n=1 Tax=Anderseniella sp. Alg231-50 TaxID=1922226 RepID=UPI000D54DF77